MFRIHMGRKLILSIPLNAPSQVTTWNKYIVLISPHAPPGRQNIRRKTVRCASVENIASPTYHITLLLGPRSPVVQYRERRPPGSVAGRAIAKYTTRFRALKIRSGDLYNMRRGAANFPPRPADIFNARPLYVFAGWVASRCRFRAANSDCIPKRGKYVCPAPGLRPPFSS